MVVYRLAGTVNSTYLVIYYGYGVRTLYYVVNGKQLKPVSKSILVDVKRTVKEYLGINDMQGKDNGYAYD